MRRFDDRDQPYFMVKHVERRAYARLTREDYFVLQQLDGRHSITDVVLAYLAEYRVFGYERVVGVVHQLAEAGFLDRPPLALLEGAVKKRVRLFDQLDAKQLNTLATFAQERSYGDGEVIVREGDFGVGWFVIQTGHAEVLERRDGGEERLRVMGAGEVFGEIAVLEHTARTATVRALEPTTCLVMSGLTLETVLDEAPEAKAQFHATIAERLGIGTPEPADREPG